MDGNKQIYNTSKLSNRNYKGNADIDNQIKSDNYAISEVEAINIKRKSSRGTAVLNSSMGIMSNETGIPHSAMDHHPNPLIKMSVAPQMVKDISLK